MPAVAEKQESDEPPVPEKKEKKDNFLMQYYRRHGLADSLEKGKELVQQILKKVGRFIKKIKIRHLRFSLSVATEDAAQTAVTYGQICSVVYPLYAFLKQQLNCKEQQFDISADFESVKSSVFFAADITAKPITLILTALAVLKIVLSFKREIKNQEDAN